MPATRVPSVIPFVPDCAACPRLATFLAETKARYPDYHCAPVPAFGSAAPSMLVVGLAPGLHGANATGRPFTGDHAGLLLYQTLHAVGRASAPVSTHVNDKLTLPECRITNAVKCVPPANKPTPAEIRTCNQFLRAELALLGVPAVDGAAAVSAGHAGKPLAIIALGRVAHEAVLSALGLRKAALPFGHGVEHALMAHPRPVRLFDSYHCSRYNTQTRRLTAEMFEAVFRAADGFARREAPTAEGRA